MKIRTTLDLTNAIDADLSWRKKELTYLLNRVDTSESEAQSACLRAAIALLYAHWEGFVISALRSYLEMVSNKRVPFEKLKPELRAGVLKTAFHELEQNLGQRESSRYRGRVRVMRDYAAAVGTQSKFSADAIVSTQSNLNSHRFLNLLAVAGLDESKFQTASAFLDESLLEKRNSVCHGERITVDSAGYRSTQNQVIGLIEQVKIEILNAAATGAYRV